MLACEGVLVYVRLGICVCVSGCINVSGCMCCLGVCVIFICACRFVECFRVIRRLEST